MPDLARPLRIAMVAPPYFSVPPDGYGGVEAVVAELVDALGVRGHHITLLAAGAAGTTAAEFLQVAPEAGSLQLGEALPEVLHAARTWQLLRAHPAELVHDHTLAGALLGPARAVPTLLTVHGPVSGDLGLVYEALGEAVQLVALSDHQRSMSPDLNWVATVPNAVRVATFPFQEHKDGFALFLGRFHPEKAPHVAIDAARAAGVPLLLAGKCSEPLEREYFRTEIEPRLGAGVEVLGMADSTRKRELLSRARCLLFPIVWDEPFGLVMVEALACGTPVVALRYGAVPEVVRDGVTGIVVDKESDLPDAIQASASLSAHTCRKDAEARFDTTRMASAYEQVYRDLLG
ncbi:MAG TPA: glycosyltransferase family 4 protein [Mycobacteriales bacterium]|nr:glycosyltransferase family 4 protein [Mycobacteriales bacterium]